MKNSIRKNKEKKNVKPIKTEIMNTNIKNNYTGITVNKSIRLKELLDCENYYYAFKNGRKIPNILIKDCRNIYGDGNTFEIFFGDGNQIDVGPFWGIEGIENFLSNK